MEPFGVEATRRGTPPPVDLFTLCLSSATVSRGTFYCCNVEVNHSLDVFYKMFPNGFKKLKNADLSISSLSNLFVPIHNNPFQVQSLGNVKNLIFNPCHWLYFIHPFSKVMYPVKQNNNKKIHLITMTHRRSPVVVPVQPL